MDSWIGFDIPELEDSFPANVDPLFLAFLAFLVDEIVGREEGEGRFGFGEVVVDWEVVLLGGSEQSEQV